MLTRPGWVFATIRTIAPFATTISPFFGVLIKYYYYCYNYGVYFAFSAGLALNLSGETVDGRRAPTAPIRRALSDFSEGGCLRGGAGVSQEIKYPFTKQKRFYDSSA